MVLTPLLPAQCRDGSAAADKSGGLDLFLPHATAHSLLAVSPFLTALLGCAIALGVDAASIPRASGRAAARARPRCTPRVVHSLFIVGCCLAVLGGCVPSAWALKSREVPMRLETLGGGQTAAPPGPQALGPLFNPQNSTALIAAAPVADKRASGEVRGTVMGGRRRCRAVDCRPADSLILARAHRLALRSRRGGAPFRLKSWWGRGG